MYSGTQSTATEGSIAAGDEKRANTAPKGSMAADNAKKHGHKPSALNWAICHFSCSFD